MKNSAEESHIKENAPMFSLLNDFDQKHIKLLVKSLCFQIEFFLYHFSSQNQDCFLITFENQLC